MELTPVVSTEEFFFSKDACVTHWVLSSFIFFLFHVLTLTSPKQLWRITYRWKCPHFLKNSRLCTNPSIRSWWIRWELNIRSLQIYLLVQICFDIPLYGLHRSFPLLSEIEKQIYPQIFLWKSLQLENSIHDGKSSNASIMISARG